MFLDICQDVKENKYDDKSSSHSYCVVSELRRKGMVVDKDEDGYYSGGIRIKNTLNYFNDNKIKYLGKDKWKVAEFCNSNGFKTPRSVIFKSGEKFDIDKIKHLDFPLVIKPSGGRQSQDVYVNVKNILMLESFIKKYKKNYIVQEHVEGYDVRCSVVDRKVVGVCVRLPFFVIGDGVLTVGSLALEKKNRVMNNPYLRKFASKRPVFLDESRVPVKGEFVFAVGVQSVSSGGLPVEITNIVSKDFLKGIESFAEKLPANSVYSVDVMTKDFFSSDSFFIIEVNANPNLLMHKFPMYGVPNNPFRDIADLISRIC